MGLTPDPGRPGFLRQEPCRPRRRWLAQQWDRHVVSRCLRRLDEDSWLSQSVANVGAWLDVWAEQ